MSVTAVARAALCAALLTTAALAGVLTSGSVPKAPYLELNDGHRLPQLGLGTWLGNSSQGRIKPQGHEVQQAAEWAIAAGYRHIDTARVYGTEPQVGAAIREAVRRGDVKREDLFVTTKLWNDRHAREAVVPALRESLAALGLDYVDLYLVHWPIGQFANGSYDPTDHLSTWRGMEEARRLGLARSIGLSNFNQSQIEGILAGCEVKPAVLQVEMNLNLQQESLRAYCSSRGIVLTAYTPFGSLLKGGAGAGAGATRVDDPTLVEMAGRYNKTVPQIVLRYLMELGVAAIPKTITKQRVEQNIDIFDFHLTAADRAALRGFDAGLRTIAGGRWADSPQYPFERSEE
ncbi:aldo-keto reductase AKR2E4 [Plutella xylostella]|uniref:aldo-keto reductase AKR2E4 n=1 Tax=Plutella xylostella TaxID=51655 RepID=UPI002032A189|nr:aldo-keto reductase AKR2E4 [Plutella xylostella]